MFTSLTQTLHIRATHLHEWDDEKRGPDRGRVVLSVFVDILRLFWAIFYLF
ncbi:hypothetical protein EXN66_Car013691 [Channa argus]|uniref:Uncharacterized protein n=1 Tax=Channa argus TaxID=215402 RepID=A0A6G1Q5U7_CHAAH|nr:hypothetical protein EXN66_Car013691 [Channa argus]